MKVPEGEVCAAVESPRAARLLPGHRRRLKPFRLHTMRASAFYNLQSLPRMMQKGFVGNAVANFSSVDPIMGEVDR